MFTGLIEEVGTVIAFERGYSGARIQIAAKLADDLDPGDSVSVSGVCLTVTDLVDDSFHAEVMNQTLSLSSLADVEVGSLVNLETALKAGDPMGGHVVQGHVDGLGTVKSVEDDGFAKRVHIEVPEDLSRYIVERGSITVDGVSLTVAGVSDDSFEVSLIPETRDRTTLGHLEKRDHVNLEVDALARYVERAVQARQ